MRKPKFRPEIRRVKLNPEQAVLMCACYTGVGPGLSGSYGWHGYSHAQKCLLNRYGAKAVGWAGFACFDARSLFGNITGKSVGSSVSS